MKKLFVIKENLFVLRILKNILSRCSRSLPSDSGLFIELFQTFKILYAGGKGGGGI